VLTIKSDYEISKASYDRILEWVKNMLPKRNELKFMIKPFGLEYQKIDIYLNFYMLYFDEYTNFTKCKNY
jgi:hypothetical protein